jgi:DNA-binding transcriptional LysR family regulator
MELRLLEYFLEVCDELHFSRAAENLGISQPTLSHQIRLLESRLNTTLFDRSGRQIKITESGKILLAHSMSIFQKIKQANIEINELNNAERGKLTIGCSGNHLLYSSIVSFHKEFPKIELSVFDTATQDSIHKIIQDEFDLAVTFLPVDHPNINCVKLCESELIVITSFKNDLANIDTIELEQLQNLPLFLLQKNFMIRKMIDDHCNRIGVHLKPVVELSDLTSLLQMTIKNKGITILPSHFLQTIDTSHIKLIYLDNDIPKKEIGVIYPKKPVTPKPVEFFISHLKNNFTQ